MLKHVEDDGTLSVLANGSQLVFVCNKGGHYWEVDAKQQESVKSDQKRVRTVDADIARYLEAM
jgi:hypothetical protein